MEAATSEVMAVPHALEQTGLRGREAAAGLSSRSDSL